MQSQYIAKLVVDLFGFSRSLVSKVYAGLNYQKGRSRRLPCANLLNNDPFAVQEIADAVLLVISRRNCRIMRSFCSESALMTSQ